MTASSLTIAFLPPPAIVAAFAAGTAILPLLYLFSRGPLKPPTVGARYPRAVLCALGLYVAAVLVLSLGAGGAPWQDVFAGLCIFITAALLLEVFWGLLAFGFTLNLLCALAKHGGPVTASQWATLFGGAEGVAGITDNRLEILLKLGMVSQEGDRVRLTVPRGLGMALVTRLAMFYFGVDRSWR